MQKHPSQATIDVSIRNSTSDERVEWYIYNWEGEKLLAMNSLPWKLSFRYSGDIKTFPDTQVLMELALPGLHCKNVEKKSPAEIEREKIYILEYDNKW